MNLARSSCSSTHAGPVDVLGAPWVCQAGPDLASIYLHARYYDSSLGMFLSPDPAGADSNSYRYGGGDPANFVDPTGLCKQNPETGEYYDCPVFPGGVAVCGDTGLTAATEDDCAWLQDEYNWNNGGWSSSFWNYMNNNAYPAPRPRVRYYFERPVVTRPDQPQCDPADPDGGCYVPPEGCPTSGALMMGVPGCGGGGDGAIPTGVKELLQEVVSDVASDLGVNAATSMPSPDYS